MTRIKSLKKKQPRTIVNIISIVIAYVLACVAITGAVLYFLHSGTQAQEDSMPLDQHQYQASSGGAVKKAPHYQMVFSTACSPFQDWQAIVFFYFAWKVKQTGTVTRIASGCKNDQAERLRQFHKEQIEVLSPNFKLHITPDFKFADDTKYFNKPFGIQHWMKNVLGYPERAAEHDDDIIMILDPDMMLLRPLTHTFYDHPSRIWKKNNIRKPKMEVTHGWPMGSMYGFGNSWKNSVNRFGNLTYVVGEKSPALKVSNTESEELYPVGPPYLATSRDMYSIVELWTVHLLRYYKVFPEFMSEMYAYCTAAAHLKLPHQLAVGFMVSQTGSRGEGWAFLDDVSRADSCQPNIPQSELPVVFHYCQRYALGRWFVGKYKLPENFFTCEAPLLRVPPRDVGTRFDWYIYPNLEEMENFTKSKNKLGIIHNAYALCTMIDLLNEASTHFKKHHCKGDTGNYEKSFVFHTEENFEKFLAHPELEVVTHHKPGR